MMNKYVNRLILILCLCFGFTVSVYAFSAPPVQTKIICNGFLKYGVPVSNKEIEVARVNQTLCRDGYVVGYSYLTKQPVWVAFELTGKSVSKRIKRKDKFRPDPAIPIRYQSELSDYKKSGYDRGHLASYASMDFDKESADQSFLLSNMSPQKAGLNRQGWAQLEKYVRFWAVSKGEIYEYTGSIYKNKKIHKTIGENKVAVPDFYFKVIYAPKQKESIAFVMPNSKVNRKDVAKYRVSIKDVENRTGLEFLTNIPKTEKDDLISSTSKMWRTNYKK